MIELKNYQKTAVKELLQETVKLLKKSNNSQSIVFQSPTGSGKTIMMQEFLLQFTNHSLWEYAFVRISIGDIASQSKKSFEKNLSGSVLQFVEFVDIQDNTLKQNQVLFLNREALKQKDKGTWQRKVLAMRDNERNENLPTYLENAHKEWRKIILIIDESHLSLDTEKAQEIISQYIKPTIQIEVSATPDTKDPDKRIKVNIDDVIKEGMIKKNILINPEIERLANQDPTDKLIITSALQKQQELQNAYLNQWSQIAPLVLIQLPSASSKTSEIDKTRLDLTIEFLKELDITTDNKKLAIWLSEDKTNKDLIDIPNSPVQVLIFKQAIATGWDCPRAQILVMFREMKSVTFEIQTVGRILRMPERKHYTDENLNIAYVFTNLAKIEINKKDSVSLKMFKTQYANRNNLYKEFSLKSTYFSRLDYQDLTSEFKFYFAKALLDKISWQSLPDKRWKEENITVEFETNKKQLIANNININDINITNEIISNGKITLWSQEYTTINGRNISKIVSLDNITQTDISIETKIAVGTDNELIQLIFDEFAKGNVGPQFSNIARSYEPIKEAIYGTLEKFFFEQQYKRSDYQKLVLKNQEFFVEVLNNAKDNFKKQKMGDIEKKINKSESEGGKTYDRNIPSVQAFGENAELHDEYQKYIFSPAHITFDSKQEKQFINDFLEKNEKIIFWYKNGVSSKDYFGIPYQDNEETHIFYPDFIVYFRDGTIGLFDTKDWITLKESSTKAKGLEQYISENQDKKIIGGMIIYAQNIFQINNKSNFDPHTPSDFTWLNNYIDQFIK